jgi:hypothetical protein
MCILSCEPIQFNVYPVWRAYIIQYVSCLSIQWVPCHTNTNTCFFSSGSQYILTCTFLEITVSRLVISIHIFFIKGSHSINIWSLNDQLWRKLMPTINKLIKRMCPLCIELSLTCPSEVLLLPEVFSEWYAMLALLFIGGSCSGTSTGLNSGGGITLPKGFLYSAPKFRIRMFKSNM